MPTLKSVKDVKEEVNKLVEEEEILVGTTIPSDDLTDAIVDGKLVEKELVLTVRVSDPEEVSEHHLREAFPSQAIIKKGISMRVVCKSREELTQLAKTTPTLNGQEAKLVPFKENTVKAQFSTLREVILKILQDALPATTFVPGKVYHLKLLLWTDAKYTYLEKSFIKAALMGAPFPKHRTKIYRWGDFFGHECELLHPLLTSQVLVSLSFSFFLPDVHPFSFLFLFFYNIHLSHFFPFSSILNK
jgi:hypothetical protein